MSRPKGVTTSSRDGGQFELQQKGQTSPPPEFGGHFELWQKGKTDPSLGGAFSGLQIPTPPSPEPPTPVAIVRIHVSDLNYAANYALDAPYGVEQYKEYAEGLVPPSNGTLDADGTVTYDGSGGGVCAVTGTTTLKHGTMGFYDYSCFEIEVLALPDGWVVSMGTIFEGTVFPFKRPPLYESTGVITAVPPQSVASFGVGDIIGVGSMGEPYRFYKNGVSQSLTQNGYRPSTSTKPYLRIISIS